MSTPKKKLFSKGDYLAVVGSDENFWLCKCRQHVYEERTKSFWIQWLEKESNLYKYPINTTYGIPKKSENETVNYYLSENWDKITVDTVIKALKLKTTHKRNVAGVCKKGSKGAPATLQRRFYQVSQHDITELSEAVSRVHHTIGS